VESMTLDETHFLWCRGVINCIIAIVCVVLIGATITAFFSSSIVGVGIIIGSSSSSIVVVFRIGIIIGIIVRDGDRFFHVRRSCHLVGMSIVL